MQWIKEIRQQLHTVGPYAQKVVAFGFWCAVIQFSIALISYRMAFFLDYHQQMLIHRTAMEAAPTCFVSGLIAALIWDLAERSYGKQ